ncbi:hypothetical protein DBIPINDM_003484 [Mesorhizobium sp. AR02]|uniref:hypothetical protein n=1 Tax=Mesorhizobium sp. AR02 TaxID=2865837 RepID=UPI00215DDA71|nr:hypothetical protein [Mesorhizobium sp. AR02]UVK56851.1 hypothetical protein DBIPINDM_003484 [Mesorhizobium sp. AR02]
MAGWLDGRSAHSHLGWSPDEVASFVPWPKRKPAEVQNFKGPTRFVATLYERVATCPDVFSLTISPSFGTGYSYLAVGDDKFVSKLTLRLEGAEAERRDTAIEEFVAIADRMTCKATGAGIPDGILATIKDSQRATFDYSDKRREVGPSGHGFNFSDFAAVAHEPHYRAFVYEVFAPSLAEKWLQV